MPVSRSSTATASASSSRRSAPEIAGPLSPDGLRELYTYLLDLTKREVGTDGTL